jgi:ribonuclease E
MGNNKPEPVRPRQEAALKNITPEVPAPAVRDKAAVSTETGVGIVARILSWFRADANTLPVPAANGRKESAPRSDNRRKPRNTQRNETSKTEKTERSPRGERNRNRETTAATPASTTTREPRKTRERREREPAAEKIPAAEIVVPVSTNGGEESASPRRRNSRRGRNSRRDAPVEESVLSEKKPRDPASGEEAFATEAQESAPHEHPHASGASAPVALIAETTHETGGLVAEVFPQMVSPSALSTATAPAVVTSVAANVTTPDAVAFSDESGSPLVPPPVEVPSTPLVYMPPAENKEQKAEDSAPVEAPKPAPTRPTPAELENELAKSGLVLVQTVAAAPAPVSAPSPTSPKGRPRRQKPGAAQTEEPLVLVETQADNGHS